ncbi:hypothetical protein PIB30_005032 [Stylosanthes scabra]|uniref:CCHC-type domain-containing protein n=1 Tax=Stylosanthes scabra TaxID=79078 RepID=A0ABU6Y0K1_9FABA|nr:hypothetical protein [Stylosanthes scabra]
MPLMLNHMRIITIIRASFNSSWHLQMTTNQSGPLFFIKVPCQVLKMLSLVSSRRKLVSVLPDPKLRMFLPFRTKRQSFADIAIVLDISFLNVECRKYKQKGHIAPNCSALFCHYCKKLGHLINACPTRPPRPNLNKNHSLSKVVPITAVATNVSSSVPPSLILTSHVESFLKQLLSLSGNNSPALSTAPGSSDETNYRD